MCSWNEGDKEMTQNRDFCVASETALASSVRSVPVTNKNTNSNQSIQMEQGWEDETPDTSKIWVAWE